MRIIQASVKYDGKTIDIPLNKKVFEDELYVDFSVKKMNDNQTRLQLTVHPKQTVNIQQIGIELHHNYKHDEAIFCNGFQSWTETRMYQPNEKMLPIRPIARGAFGQFGDYSFCHYPAEEGSLHSWNYTYIQSEKMAFIGSLNERTGYTLFKHDARRGTLIIEKDCAGLELSHSYPALDILLAESTDNQAFKQYFDLANIKPPSANPIVGWTSWYHYYTNISEQIILDNLSAFVENDVKIDIFQIDDGYQTRVGDWQSIKPNFPNGMAVIADKIHVEGFKAGLWLAPFICEKKSEIFKKHPDWILKDKAGKLVKAGWNPLWSGWFYALDFYHPEVQNYIMDSLITVLQKWRFDMVKLDFLYAVALAPPPHKTRGQVMHEAMSFLRNIVGDKLILGCGVPLGSAFGLVDYCRVGADIHTRWEHKLLRRLRGRERVSTVLSLQNTLTRWQLDGKAFFNDPDVFMLRKKKQNLTLVQQHTLLLINVLLGSVLFTSDNVRDYTEDTWAMYHSVMKWKNSTINNVICEANIYEIHFTHEDRKWVAVCNLTAEKQSHKNQKLMPFQSVVIAANLLA